MKNIFVFLLLILPLTAYAQNASELPVSAELGIVAIVNDEVITTMDVADRTAFILATTNLPNDPQAIQRMIPQITRQLIDEKLQLQDAARLGVTIDRGRIREAIEGIAARQNTTPEVLYAGLESKGISREVFDEQLKAQIAWQLILGRMVRPNVSVTDAEVERARLTDSLKLTAEGAIEVEIVSLILPVNTPEEEEDTKELAEKLVTDLRNGASFEQVASQFGTANTTPTWVPLADLDPGLGNALKQAVPGSVSNPARTLDGYVIIKLLNRRGISSAEANDSQLLLKDILLALENDDSGSEADLSVEIAKEVAKNPGTCQSDGIDGLSGLEDMNITVQFVNASFSELSPTVQELVSNLSVGGVSQPFATPEGIRVMMLCERTDTPPEMASAEETYTKLMNKKLELESQKYMRDLRRDAFIEFKK